MGKWDVRIPSELMGSGSLPQIIESHGDGTESWIASVGSISVAMQIVREHNAHEGLVELAKEYFSRLDDDIGECDPNDEIGHAIGCGIDTKMRRVNAVLAQAEGRE